MKICVLGYTGFVGSAVYKLLQNVDGHIIFGVNSHTYLDVNDFDVVINCAGFSEKYIANKNPNKMELVENSIFEKISNLRFKSLIHISSIEAELELDSYGILKKQMEQRILSKYKQATVLRLGGIIGGGLKKNVIFDIINNKLLFVTADSIYNFITTDEITNIVLYLMNNVIEGVINVGASKSILVLEIVKLLRKDVVYGSKKEVYNIDVSRLSSFYSVKSSKDYIEEFMASNDYEYTGQKLWYHTFVLKELVYISSLLKRNGIPFWLCGGALLGAVRNGKMIPWDYDVDLGIFRKDVKRLISLAPQVNKDGFEFFVHYIGEGEGKKIYVDDNVLTYRRKHLQIATTDVTVSLFPSLQNTELDATHKELILQHPVHPFKEKRAALLSDIHIDITSWYIEGTMCLSDRYSLAEVQKFDEIEFEGRKYPCLYPPESYLQKLYGKDWRTPKVCELDVKCIKYFDSSNQDILQEIEKYTRYSK